MKLKVTVEVLAEETDSTIATGTIIGELDLTKGSDKQPILTVRMSNILDQVREIIYTDSNS